MVLRPGGGIGAGGSDTGLVEDLGEGGGSGAEGSEIGAVECLAEGVGIEPVVGLSDTGEVDSRGWVTPLPGRARRVMRTVSFFKGTAEVLGCVACGMAVVLGVIGVSSGSLIVGLQVRKLNAGASYLADWPSLRQSLSPNRARFRVESHGLGAGLASALWPCWMNFTPIRRRASMSASGPSRLRISWT